MPLIIDANRCGDFTQPICNHAPKILSEIHAKRVFVAVGGKVLTELMKTKLSNLVLEWIRAGRAIRVDYDEPRIIADRIDEEILESNDVHILALALVTGARLLYTEDEKLISDFKRRDLITPRGKVITIGTPDRTVSSLLQKFGGPKG